MFLVNRNMEVGCSSNSSQVDNHDFFSNSSVNAPNQNPNLDFTVEIKLFNTVIKAKPSSVGFMNNVENNSSSSSSNVDLSLSLSLPNNNTEENRGGDEDVVINAVPLNMYNPLNNSIEWMITKRLTKSDCNEQCRLLIRKNAMEANILPLLSETSRMLIRSPTGLPINVYDCDIRQEKKLTLKKWESTEYYGLMEHWRSDFVKPRGLVPGDVVGLYWDVDSYELLFSVLYKTPNYP